ncbi:uncharacterized protein MONBRDRAFT_33131 [Monosiga brevicollis MX1]|uniref:VPS37 C-terminal domain-containing protein n=1 Tax=Monosiga brevicollis TaxID=81824 RepID=A9V3W3_MONBE|nr:uncharacterized protein MONBRDRAFT_33131 [Monosiga brevicollis MX1]EDQ87781.1 predicted protein [Monosiga brevicollis MX1]|eukprot:XP_001747314.1 hypothetical protein [Monosiga brevicollis MX1]
MAWFSRAPAAAPPPSMDLSSLRSRQIDGLLMANLPGSVSTKITNAEYEVPFTANGRPVLLHIKLPLNFPQMQPVLTITPNCHHPVLNASGQVCGIEALQSWKAHSSLAKVVEQTVDHLIRNPPSFPGDVGSARGAGQYGMPSTQPAYGAPNPYATAGNGGPPAVPYHQAVQPTSDLGMSTTSSSQGVPSSVSTPAPTEVTLSNADLPELDRATIAGFMQDMSTDELTEMAESMPKVRSFVANLTHLQVIRERVEFLRQERTRLAEANMKHEPELNRLKSEVKALTQQLAELDQSLATKLARYTELSSQYDRQGLVAALKVKQSEAEEASEDLVSQFRNEDLPVEDFVKQFKAARVLYHERRLKEERFLASN